MDPNADPPRRPVYQRLDLTENERLRSLLRTPDDPRWHHSGLVIPERTTMAQTHGWVIRDNVSTAHDAGPSPSCD